MQTSYELFKHVSESEGSGQLKGLPDGCEIARSLAASSNTRLDRF